MVSSWEKPKHGMFIICNLASFGKATDPMKRHGYTGHKSNIFVRIIA